MSYLYKIGGELKGDRIDHFSIIGIDDTVHDIPAQETPADPPELPDQVNVVCEDDIVGAQASIVYDDCLKQLLRQVHLPGGSCTSVLDCAAVCESAGPFDTNLTSRGTGIFVEWVSLTTCSELKYYIVKG